MGEIVVSHGYGASDDSVWFPCLTRQLAAAGHRVIVPRLPGSDAPRREPWRKAYGEAVQAVGAAGSTLLVGHSIGAVNVLRLLEQHDPEAQGEFAGVLLVAGSAHEVGYEELAGFFEGGFDWARIRSTARGFRVLQAMDDPVNQPDVRARAPVRRGPGRDRCPDGERWALRGRSG